MVLLLQYRQTLFLRVHGAGMEELEWADAAGVALRRTESLVAVTGADGDLVAALGAAAVENGGARLGLHAGEEAVGLGAVAAVRLKGTLRHGTELLRQEIDCR
ncbi:MAG: hypothetical protein BGO25_13960 [Acidobacteriales bacterium 59-55]|nr:MAG: hypothetical protein BGO25_13960 [Acidobacteriales bacterium 59-55]